MQQLQKNKIQRNDITFTFMHLADTFIQSDLQCIQTIHFSVCVKSVCVIPGN